MNDVGWDRETLWALRIVARILTTAPGQRETLLEILTELESCIEHAVRRTSTGVLESPDLPPSLRSPVAAHEGISLPERIQALERAMILDALKQTQGNMAKAARRLGITARMVRYKVRKLGIDGAVP